MQQKIELYTEYADFSQRFLFDFTNRHNKWSHSEHVDATLGWDRLNNQVALIKRTASSHHSYVAREYKAIRSLEYHPNLSSAWAYGQRLMTPYLGQWDYLAMPYYAEGNLADWIRNQSLTSAQILSLTKGLLEGIASLHRQHNIHGWLNPSTIWISQDEQNEWIPIISGLDAWLWISPTDRVLSYIDPERVRRNELVVTVPFDVDLWAFGVILYELTTGQHPFAYDSADRSTVVERIVDGNLPDLLNHIPAPYQAIIRHCLLPASTGRIIRAEELLAML